MIMLAVGISQSTGLGPFTTGLMLLVLGIGCLVFPFRFLVSLIELTRPDSTVDGKVIFWGLVIGGGMTLVEIAFALDWIYAWIVS